MPESSDLKPTSKKIVCPRCGQLCFFEKQLNPSRPFCSERCQLIDLGKWASEDYRVPASTEPNGSADLQSENATPAQDDE